MEKVSSITFFFIALFSIGFLGSITLMNVDLAEAEHKKNPQIEYSSDYNRYSDYEKSSSYEYGQNYIDNHVIVTMEIYQCEPASEFECNITETNDKFFVTGPSNLNYKNCNNQNIYCPISLEDFNIKIIKGAKFPGSMNSLKLNLDKNDIYFIEQEGIVQNSMTDKICKGSGFDHGLVIESSYGEAIDVCVLFEGKCSGSTDYKENRECIIKNYIPINSFR